MSEAGQFQPGQSGNPNGRPKGSRPKALVALDALADGEAEAVAKAMIEKAKAGDTTAGKAILDRVWPARKGALVEFDLPVATKPEDFPAAIAAIIRQVSDAVISPDEGLVVISLLDMHRKALETSELAARLASLEERVGKR